MVVQSRPPQEHDARRWSHRSRSQPTALDADVRRVIGSSLPPVAPVRIVEGHADCSRSSTSGVGRRVRLLSYSQPCWVSRSIFRPHPSLRTCPARTEVQGESLGSTTGPLRARASPRPYRGPRQRPRAGAEPRNLSLLAALNHSHWGAVPSRTPFSRSNISLADRQDCRTCPRWAEQLRTPRTRQSLRFLLLEMLMDSIASQLLPEPCGTAEFLYPTG